MKYALYIGKDYPRQYESKCEVREDGYIRFIGTEEWVKVNEDDLEEVIN